MQSIEQMSPGPLPVMVSCVAMALFPLTGFAQQAKLQAAADRDDVLEEVVTTAQTVRENYSTAASSTALGLPASILDTPLSIQVVGKALLEDQQATSLWDALKNVSGVSSRGTNSGVNEDFVIRGFQLDPRRNYYRDGARFYNQFSLDPENLERVEVLKGPASILYGALEPGGIINLAAPKLSTGPTHRVRLSSGSYDYLQGSASSSGPLVGDDVFYRIYGSALSAESFRDFVEQDRRYINPTIYWNASESTTLKFTFEAVNDEHTADAGIVAILDRPARVPIDTFYGEPSYKTEKMDNWSAGVKLTQIWSPALTQNSSVSFYDTSWDRRQVSVEGVRGGIVGLAGGPGFPGSTNTLLNRSVFDNELSFRELATQHDFVYLADTGPVGHKILAGVSAAQYDEREISGDRVFSGPANANRLKIDIFDPRSYYGLEIPPDYSLFRDQTRDERTYGAYLQDMVSLGDKWIFLGGVRYDRTDFDQDTLQGGAFRTTTRSDSSVSPRAGLVFKPTDALSLYTSFTRSFSPRTGLKIVNEPASATAPIALDNTVAVDPEEAEQYEIGAKLAAFEDRLNVTLSLYDLKRIDMVEANPRFSNYSVQIGEQRSQGVDLDVSALLGSALRLTGSYGYLDARIEKDADRPAWDGNRLDNAPEHSASLWANYSLENGLGFGAGVFYVGERQGDLDNDFLLPSYTRVDATLSYRLNRARVALTGKNLTDKLYYQNSWRRDRIMPGAPRSMIASLSYDF